ncbi:MAG: hypothetical protein IPO90_03955 [Flavobacteriales bacterium]|nr:hypothetical protein [Flavobacteriales bacterium]
MRGAANGRTSPTPSNRFKQRRVVDNLVRLGGLELPEITPSSLPRTTHYRNKLEYTAGAFRWFTSEELASMGDII